MEHIEQNLIERYLAQELTPAERADIERRAETDPQFRKELEEYTLAIEALKLTRREELKNRFRERDKMLDRKNNTGSAPRRVSFWWLAAAASVSILVAWFFLYTPDRTVDQANADTKKDSMDLRQNLPVIIDTIKATPPEYAGKEHENASSTKNKGQELYAENFTAYKDDAMDPTSRGEGEELKPSEKFQLAYWEGNYKEALADFQTMNTSDKQNDNFRFLYANVLMALNRSNEASLILTGIIRNHTSIFGSEPYLYLALCNIKAGKDAEARKNLQAYLDAPDTVQKEKAKKLLASLK